MTLMEVLAALVVFSLVATFTFSNLGPWLHQGRSTEREAAFWGDLGPASLTLSELSAAMVERDRTLRVSTSEARFSAYDPRLAPAPRAVALRIETSATGSRLLLSGVSGADTLLLDAPHPLRFAAATPNALVVEAQNDRHWTPVIIAPWASTAPLSCSFDPVSRTCQ
jgi:hypothetical protein